jgi:hypothetical protein
MTHAALILGRDVIGFFGSCNTGVVTGCTITAHDVHVMHKSTGEGAECVVDDMARGTVLTGHNMTHRFPFADIAIMAGQAVAGIRAGMVKQCSDKAGRRMTVGARLIVRRCRDVIQEFTYADHIIMT